MLSRSRLLHGFRQDRATTQPSSLQRRFAKPAIGFLALVSWLVMSSNHVPKSLIQLRVSRVMYTPYNTTPSVLLPSWTNNLVDVWDTAPPALATPLFWYIPKGGGATINKILTYCLNFTVASDRGRRLNQSVSKKIHLLLPSLLALFT